MRRVLACLVVLGAARVSVAAPPGNLVGQLQRVRVEITRTEKDLLNSLKEQKSASERLRKIDELVKLQKQESLIGQKRILELKKFLSELELRKVQLEARVADHKKVIRRFLIELGRKGQEGLGQEAVTVPEAERIEAPKRRVISRLVRNHLRKVEELRADLADAHDLRTRIETENEELAGFLAEAKQREELLQFHERLQSEIFKNKFQDRVTQLESYRRLKDAETEVETLMSRFNVRTEFDRVAQEEAQVSRSIFVGDFAKKKGSLRWPMVGKVAMGFGRQFDPKSGLTVFRKGIEIEPSGNSDGVHNIFAGKVVFAGDLPTYGNVVIIDHGKNYFSLSAHLSQIHLRVGDLVAEGEIIGAIDPKGPPLYFEIRSANVAVNPLKWVTN